MHPDLEALVEFCDATGRTAPSRLIASHVAKCASCTAEVIRIQRSAVELTGGTVPNDDHRKGFAAVQAAMTRWRTHRAASVELRQRLHERIETYFGSAAISVLDDGGMSVEELLAKTSAMLDVFLGEASAESVKDDILAGLRSAEAQRQ